MPHTDFHSIDSQISKSPFEFTLPILELDAQFAPGEVGVVMIPVEVVEVGKETVTFRKRGRTRLQAQFREATVEEMEDNLPVAQR